MARWSELRSARPDLADAGQALLYQFGVGLAFLATVRPDGGPRVHPICPVVQDDGLFAFVVPSPKRDDLVRDGRYSLHSFPADENEDAFYVSGRAALVAAAQLRMELTDRYIKERPKLDLTAEDLADQFAFEFDISTCLVTRTRGHGDARPEHVVWHAD